ncbi:uncharacterized protein LOC143225606 [Tachypleus tridentatus]|uniref:uncharacterized protein LOC143225606 n=1 Tax=Tachypleus tridentatus TaxID=6853 RepID=UPI003FD5EF54
MTRACPLTVLVCFTVLLSTINPAVWCTDRENADKKDIEENLPSTEKQERTRLVVNLDDEPSRWPGYMEPLGLKFPQKKIDVHKGYPSVTKFYNEFVIPSSPVVISSALDQFVNIYGLSDASIASLSQAYTVFMKVRSRKDGHIVGKMTIRQFIQRYREENLYLDSPLPDSIKMLLPLPRCLRCNDVIKELHKTRFLYHHGIWHHPLRVEDQEQLHCQFDGEAVILLINFAEFPKRSQVLDKKNGSESGVNVENVDFQKYPALGEVPVYHQATLAPGKCMFIPAHWLYQITSLSKDARSISLSIYWNRKIIVPSKKTCGDVSDDTKLSQGEFAGDPKDDVFGIFKNIALHEFIQFFFDEGKLQKLTFSEFEDRLKKDEKRFKDLVTWDEECSQTAKEFFNQMDTNADQMISPEDLDGLTEKDLDYLTGIVVNRQADFKDIMDDQQSTSKSSSIGDIAKSLTQNYEKELHKILEEGFDDILKDAKVDGSLKFDSKGRPKVIINKEKLGDKTEFKTEEVSEPPLLKSKNHLDDLEEEIMVENVDETETQQHVKVQKDEL